MDFWFGDFAPQRVLLAVGPFQIYWYSVLMVAAVAAGFAYARKRYLLQNRDDKALADLVFYVILASFIGARLWHVFVFHWDYYSQYPAEIIKIWEGGIAIQGALIAGSIMLLAYCRLKKLDPWQFADIMAPGLALGQMIGRWGNFFNQELYGLPTARPWGLFIEPQNRVPGFEQFSHFHPTFFYESVLNLTLFLLLWRLAKKNPPRGSVALWYFIGYGAIRFIIDFVRIDPMPVTLGLRLSQWVSIFFIMSAAYVWWWRAQGTRKKLLDNSN